MYRVLIVDDERPLLERMRGFDWAGEDCQCVGEMTSAEEALAFCRRCTPHIVITDINMPVMDGLQLMERLKQAYPAMQVILLTAYQDFGYVQQALRGGATDYLVKDMNLNEHLPQALRRAKEALERSGSRGFRVDFLQRGGRLLLWEPSGCLPTEATTFFQQFQGTLATACTPADDAQIGALLDDWSALEPDAGMIRFGGGFELLLHRSLRESEGRIRSLAGSRRFSMPVHFLLSGPVTDVSSYQTCHARNLREAENAFYDAELPTAQLAGETAFASLPAPQQSAWLRDVLALGLRHRPICAFVQEQLVPFLRENRVQPTQVRGLFERMLQRQEADYAARADMAAHEQLRTAPTLSALTESYLACVERMTQQQSGYGYLVDEALACMERHLHESTLSLQEVADDVHISPGYLSKKLKEATGESFQDALIRMRMERAAALLKEGRVLVYEAAEQLGYQNYRSFSAAFEKYYHCNPKKYRG